MECVVGRSSAATVRSARAAPSPCAFAVRGAGARVLITEITLEHLGKIVKHYGRPTDIEWARDGDIGKLHSVQVRPKTVASKEMVGVVEDHQMLEAGRDVLVEDRPETLASKEMVGVFR